MPQALENPFTPDADKPQKRLFGGEKKPKRNLGEKSEARLEKIKKVKYGDFEIFRTQVKFLKRMEKELIRKEQNNGGKLSPKEAQERVSDRIEIDDNGNIIKIKFSGTKIKNLPNLDELINLRVLQCAFNELETLPNLDKLTKLLKLNCSGNKIENLPNLDRLINLEILQFSSNKLENMPNLNNLRRLWTLRGYKNNLSEEEKEKIKSQVPENCEVTL